MCHVKPLLVLCMLVALLGVGVISLQAGRVWASPASAGTQDQLLVMRQVVAVATNSYAAEDAAMNMGAAASPLYAAASTIQHQFLPVQAQVSVSPSGAFLYQYDVYRISAFRAWAARHAQDYATIHVWSTFAPLSVTITGSRAIVVGNETLHVDATIRNNGQRHVFSPAKQVVQASLKSAGLFLAFGQTNHAQALISHTITLSRGSSGWLIESDAYWDPLAQSLAADHHTLLTSAQTAVSRQVTADYATYSYVYNRQQAITYAETWWDNCNPSYACYMQRDVDCANFVSQSIYDGNGGNLPGDDTWYAGSYAFVNANGLYNYLTNSPYGSTYNYAAASYTPPDPLHPDYATAAYDDDWYEYPGDLIFYDWGNVFGWGNPDGVIDHVAISVVQDANGYTYEDAHTANLHHWYWDLGGGNQTGYYFVILKDSGYSTWPQ